MTGLPKGWDYPAIEDILTPLADGRLVHQGWSPQCERFPAETADDWGVLKTTAVQPGAFVAEENKQLPPGMEPRSGIEVRPGDLLLTCAGPRARCGVTCLIRDTRPRLMLSGKMYRFRVNERDVDPRFVEQALLSPALVQSLDEIKTGISESGLNLTHSRFRALRIPLAPRAEQERIVAAIEEAFSKLDAGEAGLRTVRHLLKRMRDAILVAAVTGRLLPQDPTDTPATKLLADLGVEPVIGEHVPAAWASARLAELANLVTDGDHRPPKRVPSGIPHLTAKNVRGGRFDLTGCSFVDDAGFAQTRSRYEPIAGDVIVTCVGTIGRVAVVPEGLTFSADRNLAAVRLKPVVEPQFAKLALGSPAIQNWMAEASGSTAQPHLYLRDLRSIVVPVAPVEEQQRIVTEVERQFSFLDACERAVDTGLARAAATRRSVLKAAFEGRLVPQDPSDEPASMLLERIWAERAAAPKPARRSRRTA